MVADLPVDVLVVLLPHFRTVKGIRQDQVADIGAILQGISLSDQAPIGKSVKADLVQAQCLPQAFQVFHVSGKTDVCPGGRPLRLPPAVIIIVDDPVPGGQGRKIGLEDTVGGRGPTRQKDQGLPGTFFFHPELFVVNLDEACSRIHSPKLLPHRRRINPVLAAFESSYALPD
jgi:hypothetical protein